MKMNSKLLDDEKEALHKWLAEQGIKTHKMHRDFSDAVPMVYLLKKHFPKYVDVHNYPPSCKLQCKYDNWVTLNNKVLKKLKIDINDKAIEPLARSSTESILEKLLYKVMMTEKAHHLSHPTPEEQQEHLWSENEEVLTVNINKKVGDAIIKLPQKMILYSIYEEIVQELQLKNNTLEMAEGKVKHLEQMLDIKSQRIDELIQHLNSITANKELA